MSISMGTGPLYTRIQYLPIPELNFDPGQPALHRTEGRESRLQRVPHSLWANDATATSQQIEKSVYAIPKYFQKQSAELFQWDTDKQPTSRKDDGVVLLVGLFNLLAVIIYACQDSLVGNQEDKDQRIILWQVQKVLDELVLKVHSSKSAANLISRAFKTPTRASWGRSISTKSINSILEQAIHEDDPLKLQKWVNRVRNNLLVEMSKSTYSFNGALINTKFYQPLKNLYFKVTNTTRRGRSFTTSLLQEVSSAARTARQLSLSDLQNILKLVSNLGKIRRRYDILPLLMKYLPSNPIKSAYGIETTFNSPSNYLRQKRSTPFKRKTRRQRKNSRNPRLSNALIPMGLMAQEPLMRRQGSVYTIHPDYVSTTNWADRWFSLLTQISPIALDFTTLYTSARTQPSCLRSLLCKSNHYWRKKGTLQATVTPFLSVLVSWVMEDTTPHSLGDSLIAIRAGWMEKNCYFLYPECQTGALSTQPSFMTYELRSLLNLPTTKAQKADKRASKFNESKQAGFKDEMQIAPTIHLQSYLKERLENYNQSSPVSADYASFQGKHSLAEETNIDTFNDQEIPKQKKSEDSYSLLKKKPYDRYDNPNNLKSEKEVVPSGRVSGMALQDRPVSRRRDTSESEAPYIELVDKLPVESQNPEVQQYPDNKYESSPIDFFRGPTYSNYMKSQMPAFFERTNFSSKTDKATFSLPIGRTPLHLRKKHKSQLLKNKYKQKRLSPAQRKSVPVMNRNKISQTKKHSQVHKYKYGVRRGLPSGNVDGVEQLQLPEELIPTPSITGLKGNQNKISMKQSSHKSDQKLEKRPLSNPIEFHLSDAVTDEHKNSLLYQYIRDRKVRHIPLLRRHQLNKLMNSIAKRS